MRASERNNRVARRRQAEARAWGAAAPPSCCCEHSTPVLGWVAFNIGKPALRQIDAMGDKTAAKGTKKR